MGGRRAGCMYFIVGIAGDWFTIDRAVLRSFVLRKDPALSFTSLSLPLSVVCELVALSHLTVGLPEYTTIVISDIWHVTCFGTRFD